jgi:hypothetical protein
MRALRWWHVAAIALIIGAIYLTASADSERNSTPSQTIGQLAPAGVDTQAASQANAICRQLAWFVTRALEGSSTAVDYVEERLEIGRRGVRDFAPLEVSRDMEKSADRLRRTLIARNANLRRLLELVRVHRAPSRALMEAGNRLNHRAVHAARRMGFNCFYF